MEGLPPLNYNVFVYVMSFFREVLSQSEYNRMSSSKVSILLISCVTALTSNEDTIVLSKEEKSKREAKQLIMQKIIEFMLTTTTL